MSDVAAAQQTAQGRQAAANRVSELRVSGNLMRLETGLYCIVNKPVAHADVQTGLPGVRLSSAPGVDSRPEQVEITTFRADGWLSGFGDAALVRVQEGPAHVLVTIYQSPSHPESAPNIQVVKLLENVPPLVGAALRHSVEPMQAGMMATAALEQAEGMAHVGGTAHGAAADGAPRVMDMVAHIQGQGDVGALLGDRLGEVGSKRWIEGFAIAPAHDIAPSEIEYQAVLGRGWLSPWVEGGEFCGSRGMALPVLGLRVRLRGDAARDFECSYTASFTDGTQSAVVPAGASCESEGLAPMESFQVIIRRRGQAAPRAAGPQAAPVVAPAASKAAAKVTSAKAAPPKVEPPKAAPPQVASPKATPPKATPPKAAPPKATPAKAVPPKAAAKAPAKPAAGPRRR